MVDESLMGNYRNTSSNRRLRECVRLVAFYQTAIASGSQVVTKEMQASWYQFQALAAIFSPNNN